MFARQLCLNWRLGSFDIVVVKHCLIKPDCANLRLRQLKALLYSQYIPPQSVFAVFFAYQLMRHVALSTINETY